MIQQKIFSGILAMSAEFPKKSGKSEAGFALRDNPRFNDVLAAAEKGPKDRKMAYGFNKFSSHGDSLRQAAVTRNRGAATKAQPRSAELSDKGGPPDEEKTAVQGKDGKIENTDLQLLAQLAGILGLQPQTLMAAVQIADPSQPMAAAGTLDEAVDKLSQILMLDPAQKELLKQVSQLISERQAIGAQDLQGHIPPELLSGGDIQNNVYLQNLAAALDSNTTLEVSATVTSSQLESLQNIGAAIEEAVLRFEQDNGQSSMSLQKPAETVESSDISSDIKGYDPQLPDAVQSMSPDQETGKRQQASNGTDSENSSLFEGKSMEADKAAASDKSFNLVEYTGMNPQDAAFELQVSENNMQTNMQTVEDNLNDRFEILKQVVDKAQVILSGDKSEMVMDLEPESLGKLTLRVVTERGLVTAKFIAESQQVKEVLESNMQLLKDSLEKQGMSVQSFSVSVGNDEQRAFQNAWERRSAGKNAFRGDRVAAPAVSEFYAEEAPSSIINYWNGSSINLTA